MNDFILSINISYARSRSESFKIEIKSFVCVIYERYRKRGIKYLFNLILHSKRISYRQLNKRRTKRFHLNALISIYLIENALN